jgi:hypothetical protein
MTVRLFVPDSLRTHCSRPRTGGYHPSTCGRSDAAGPQGPGHDRRGPAARDHPGRAAGDPPVGSAVHRLCRAAWQDPDAESTERRHLPRASTRRSARSRRATRASRSVAPRPGPPFSAKVLTAPNTTGSHPTTVAMTKSQQRSLRGRGGLNYQINRPLVPSTPPTESAPPRGTISGACQRRAAISTETSLIRSYGHRRA